MRIIYFLLLFCCVQICPAQTYSSLINSNPFYVEEIDVSQLKENQLYISMPFAKQTVLNPEQKKQLNERVTIKLELVYTKYRKASSFNQKQLNNARLTELNKLAPSLFENRFWEFGLISQTNGNSPEICNKMFHGFIVTFRPNSTNSTLALEANYLNDLVASMLKQDSIDADSIPKKQYIKTRFDSKWGYLHDTIYYEDTVKPPAIPDFFYLQSLYNDTSVLSAFNRNPSWKNFIVVTDVTGSMSPYSAQVIVWLKKQAENKKASSFVFFNDGDDKESRKKKPLETNGIYAVNNKGLQVVINAAIKCMKNGSGGGEGLENDVEAIIEGAKQDPSSESVILIADNYESMRDYEYIKKINKPVHVILCGSENMVNVQYLDLARQTKGTLHTPNSDVSILETIKESEHFFIDEKEYTYEKGRFHSVYNCPRRHTPKNIKTL